MVPVIETTNPIAKEAALQGTDPIADQQRIYTLINKANELPLDSVAKAFDFIEQALALSMHHSNARGEAYSYNTLGALHYGLNQYDNALKYYTKALEQFTVLNEQAPLYHLNGYLGSSYDALERYPEAVIYYTRFLESAQQEEINADILSTQKSLARVYYNMENYELAKSTYEEVIELEKLHGTEDGVIDAYNHLGMVLDAVGNDQQAEDAYEQSYQLADSSGQKEKVSNFFSRMGKRANKKKNRSEEFYYNSRGLDYSSETGELNSNQEFNQSIGNLYLEEDNTAEAIPFLKRSVDLAGQLGELEAQVEAYEALSKAYEKEGNFEQALENYRNFVAVSDSLRAVEQGRLLAELRLNNEVGLREARIANLEAEMTLNQKQIDFLEKEQDFQSEVSDTQRWIIYGLVSGLLVVLLASYLFFRSSKQKRRANQLLALRSLRSQMNPHFIFNSLNSVNSFISQNDERSANKYLADFSRLMRTVMENSKHDFVSLESEIKILELYLNLEHFRFSDKFDYTFEVDEELDAEQLRIPPMLIQPYIENAIWHGLRYKETKGWLKVEFKQKEKFIVVLVSDNGIGRKRSQEIKTKNQRDTKSTGLRNTSDRLELINKLHKTRYALHIEDLNPNEAEPGTQVELRISITTPALETA